MSIGTVVLLPRAHLPGDAADVVEGDPAAERREIQADLLAHRINVYVVPDTPYVEDEDLRHATAHWVAHIAMTLTAAQPEKPILLVAFGAAGRLLAALGFSQKASRRPVAGYVVVDGSIPKAGAGDWPDAPVTYISTGKLSEAENFRQAELRGWTVEKTDNVAAILHEIVASS